VEHAIRHLRPVVRRRRPVRDRAEGVRPGPGRRVRHEQVPHDKGFAFPYLWDFEYPTRWALVPRTSAIGTTGLQHGAAARRESRPGGSRVPSGEGRRLVVLQPELGSLDTHRFGSLSTESTDSRVGSSGSGHSASTPPVARGTGSTDVSLA
jgi:hypothetical protein